jgi:hypothetical protein
MPANKKPAKKYRPKLTISNPIEFVMSGLVRAKPQSLTRAQLHNHSSLVALKSGDATNHDWDNLCAALNMSMVLCERGSGPEYLPDISAGMAALQAVGVRWVTWNKWQLTAAEEDALSTALAVHDAHLAGCLVKDIELAQKRVSELLACGKIKYCVRRKKKKSESQEAYDECREVGL